MDGNSDLFVDKFLFASTSCIQPFTFSSAYPLANIASYYYPIRLFFSKRINFCFLSAVFKAVRIASLGGGFVNVVVVVVVRFRFVSIHGEAASDGDWLK